MIRIHRRIDMDNIFHVIYIYIVYIKGEGSKFPTSRILWSNEIICGIAYLSGAPFQWAHMSNRPTSSVEVWNFNHIILSWESKDTKLDPRPTLASSWAAQSKFVGRESHFIKIKSSIKGIFRKIPFLSFDESLVWQQQQEKWKFEYYYFKFASVIFVFFFTSLGSMKSEKRLLVIKFTYVKCTVEIKKWWILHSTFLHYW